MVPISNIDRAAVSGITGSISIACWIIVFTPQLYENFKRQSADGLSLTFIVLWLLGDIFNVIGAILQGVLPTMTILAIYYTLADIVLLIQCLVYNRRQSKIDLSHLSPATPLLHAPVDEEDDDEESVSTSDYGTGGGESSAQSNQASQSTDRNQPDEPVQPFWKTVVYNTIIVFLVVLAGVLGWVLSSSKNSPSPKDPHIPENDTPLQINVLGQVFGYLCAVLYLGSRFPQLMLNFERKSCEGISFLFFLFACLGNLTYVISILANDLSWKYLIINASWLLGSVGTLVLDGIIFIQFWIYSEPTDDLDSESSSSDSGDE